MKNEIVRLKTACKNNHVKAVMVVNDYSKIITPEWNRKFVPSGLKDLIDSMSANGVLTAVALVKIKNSNQYLVVNGNHRTKVAKEQGHSITAYIVDIKATGLTENELMIWLNITPKKWKPADYLNNGVVYHKSDDYIKLNQLWEETDFAIPALYTLFSYDVSATNRKLMFEVGEWKMTTPGLGNKTIRQAENLMDVMPFFHKTNFLKALVQCVNKSGYDSDHMIKQAKRYKGQIYDSGDHFKGHLDMLHNIYNHRALEEEQLVLNVK